MNTFDCCMVCNTQYTMHHLDKQCFDIFCTTRRALSSVSFCYNNTFASENVVKKKKELFQAPLTFFCILWHLSDTRCFRLLGQDQIKSWTEAVIQVRIFCVTFLGYCKEIINSCHQCNRLKVPCFLVTDWR